MTLPRKEKSEHPAPCHPPLIVYLHPPWPYCEAVKMFLLCRCTTVAPPPPPLRPASHRPSYSSASAAAHVLCLCRSTFFYCCFFLMSSASMSPLHHRPYLLVLCSIRHISSDAVVHLILPLSLVCRCACCALVDCCLLLVAAPLLPLHHHSCCLSIVVRLFAGVPHHV